MIAFLSLKICTTTDIIKHNCHILHEEQVCKRRVGRPGHTCLQYQCFNLLKFFEILIARGGVRTPLAAIHSIIFHGFISWIFIVISS